MADEIPGPAKINVLGELTENLLAPELYVFNATSFAIISGVVTITFASSRIDNSGLSPVRRQVVVARLSMPLVGAMDLATGLYTFLERQGVKFVSQAEKDHMQ